MQPPHQHSRINLAELKAQIIKKLGPEGSKQYFYYLNRLLSLKLSKVEFNKICLRIVGKENIPLHNQFVHSILKNACNAKVPPPIHDKDVFKSTRAAAVKEPPADGYQKSGPHPSPTRVPNPLVLSNGDILSLSHRKVRSGIRDRRVGDHSSPLGPNGKADFASQQSTTMRDNDSSVILENGDLTPCDIQRPVQHHQGIMQQAENERDMRHLPAKLSASKRLPDGSVAVHSKDHIEAVVEDGKNISARSLLRAPLGIPFFPVSVGVGHRGMPLANSSASSFNNGGLLDTKMLRERMELIAAMQGLEGVSMDCANLLNNGLEAYLKSLIKSCIELVGARSGQEPTKNSTHKHQAHGKLVNGVRPGHHYQMQSSSRPLEDMREQKPHYPVSLLDFRIAMELKPQQLGEDWPLLLEKICTHAFEE
uniref:Transcriptional coactivator Hfi1/Transcriptional adapter 1 n=1 Tax=Davidia involucrata TaxID=16924 RepID=A0A5B7AVK8_DAVIN